VQFFLPHKTGISIIGGEGGEMEQGCKDEKDKILNENKLAWARLIGRYPTPGFASFVWGGLIF